MSIIQKAIGIGMLFFLTIGSGFWLSYSGKPLNTVIFSVHKLIAFVTVIFTGLLIHNLLKNTQIVPKVLILISNSGLLILTLFITGVFLSLGKLPYGFTKIVHGLSTIFAIFSIAATFYYVLK